MTGRLRLGVNIDHVATIRDDLGRAHRIGMIAARLRCPTRVADRGDVIDVDAQSKSHAFKSRLPGFSAGIAANSGGSASGA